MGSRGLAPWKEVAGSWKAVLPASGSRLAQTVCSSHGRDPFGLWTESQSSLPSLPRRRTDGEGRCSPGASACGAQAGPHKRHGCCRSGSLVRELRARCPSPSQGLVSAPSWITCSVSSLMLRLILHFISFFTLELSSLHVPIPPFLLVRKHPDTALELPAQPWARPILCHAAHKPHKDLVG